MASVIDYRQNIDVYHTNTEEKCRRFLEGGFTVSDDRSFLGAGMYFWDNFANGKFWRSVKKRQTDEKICIVKAKLCIDEVLDLTDLDVINSIEAQWNKYQKKIKELDAYRANGDSYKLGMVLDVLPFINSIPVRKAIFDYKKEDNGFKTFSTGIKTCSFSDHSRVVYMAKNKSVILGREKVEE